LCNRVDISFEYIHRNAGIISVVVFTGIATEFGVKGNLIATRNSVKKKFSSLLNLGRLKLVLQG
jgi:hypothetical protein